MRSLRAICAAALFLSLAAAQELPSEGSSAPDFTLQDQDGIERTLSDYQGQRVLLYFYLRDDTPGCTKEAKDLRDDFPNFQAAGITILGISFDPPDSHAEFRDKHGLPFTLLSDVDKKVSVLYGTQGSYPFATRRSFLIDVDGIILHIIRDVDVTTHSKDVLNIFNASGSQL